MAAVEVVREEGLLWLGCEGTLVLGVLLGGEGFLGGLCLFARGGLGLGSLLERSMRFLAREIRTLVRSG